MTAACRVIRAGAAFHPGRPSGGQCHGRQIHHQKSQGENPREDGICHLIRAAAQWRHIGVQGRPAGRRRVLRRIPLHGARRRDQAGRNLLLVRHGKAWLHDLPEGPVAERQLHHQDDQVRKQPRDPAMEPVVADVQVLGGGVMQLMTGICSHSSYETAQSTCLRPKNGSDNGTGDQ